MLDIMLLQSGAVFGDLPLVSRSLGPGGVYAAFGKSW